MPQKRTRELPRGWQVKEDYAVGVTYFDETGYPVYQHPYDTDAALAMAIDAYRSRPQGGNGSDDRE